MSRYFPAWYLGTHPDKRLVLVGYEAAFAASWGGITRDLLREWGPLLWDVDVDQSTSAKHEWAIAGHNGGMLTAGIGGPITGRGADLLLIDDPIKNAEESLSQTIQEKHWEWWQSTARPRIEPGGAVALIMTRWGDQDLTGRLLRDQETGGDRWDTIRLPAIAERDEYDERGRLFRKAGEALWPERWPIEELEKTKRATSPYWWAALYQQNPGQYGSFEFPADWTSPRVWADEWPDQFDVSVCTLDPSKGKDAKRGDYSALIFAGLRHGKLWIDCAMHRLPINELAAAVFDWNVAHKNDAFGVEANQFQELLIPVFNAEWSKRAAVPPRWVPIQNTENKLLRIQRLGGDLGNDLLRFRRTAGCELLLDQLRRFPVADHDDGPDALEMSLRLIDEVWRARQSMADRVFVAVA